MSYLWFPKRAAFVPSNYQMVTTASVCPDQRKFRRLKYKERVLYSNVDRGTKP